MIKSFKFFSFALAFANIIVWSSVSSLPDQKLHLKFYDVGQGDSALIKTVSNYKILIDGGPNDKVLSYLGADLPLYDHTIDLVIVTHPHQDHFAGIKSVIERYNVKQIWLSQMVGENKDYQALLQTIAGKKLKVGYPTFGDSIDFQDGLKLVLLHPTQNFSNSDPNLNSIVILSEMGNFKALFTGDAGEQVQPYSGEAGAVTVLKVPHHGSATALREDYLKILSPQISIISVGKKNPYGHPSPITLKELEGVKSQIFRTDKQGTIEVVSDGRSWYTKPNPPTVSGIQNDSTTVN